MALFIRKHFTTILLILFPLIIIFLNALSIKGVFLFSPTIVALVIFIRESYNIWKGFQQGSPTRKDNAVFAFFTIIMSLIILSTLPQTPTFVVVLPTFPPMPTTTISTEEQISNLTMPSIPTSSPTFTPTPMPWWLREVERNADWDEYGKVFNQVEMMFVPKGRFSMGSIGYSDELGLYVSLDEQPVHEQIFDKPFWIDRYEVTNAQFAKFGGTAAFASTWTSQNQPRDSVSWSEARDFCISRDARLPTEREWEYATRGPDSWIYPWGNSFGLGANIVFGENSGGQTVDVGSKEGGKSWVGAYDLIGNVWEWTSTIYDTYSKNSNGDKSFPYPYQIDDGREDLDRIEVKRVLRGASWANKTHDFLSAVYRFRDWPNPELDGFNTYGFRCVRDFQLGDLGT
jgi:formylglycine-generating enzyme required for sulfatase activity